MWFLHRRLGKGTGRRRADRALTIVSRQSLGQKASVVDTLAAETLTPEHSVLADERLQYLRAAVKSLPERMRYVVEEIYFGDRTVKDLAAELGSTHAAVSQQRSEAIRLMRDGLTAHYADDPEQPLRAPVQDHPAAPQRLPHPAVRIHLRRHHAGRLPAWARPQRGRLNRPKNG